MSWSILGEFSVPFALFKNENLARGLPQKGKYQAGVSDTDASGFTLERGILIPFPSDPLATWVYYDVAMACHLDSGIVVHRRLPQVDNAADVLASCFISDKNIDKLTGRGVNLKSNDQYTDVVQRMAHSRYWFRLFGQAMRIGQQVPIPGAKSIGNVPLIPDDDTPQIGYNKLVGNYGGVPLYHAVWSLWYTLASPPRVQVAPVPANLAAHISDASALPKGGIGSPVSGPDDEAQTTQPIQLQTGVVSP